MTLAALLAVVLLMAGLLHAMSIAPASGEQETIGQLNEKQDGAIVSDFLQVGMETGLLKDSVLYWDKDQGRWVSAPTSGYYTRTPGTHPLQGPLEKSFAENGVAYNIAVEYETTSGDTDIQRMVYQGTPGPNAVYETTTFVLYDDDNLVGPDSSETVKSTSSYFAPDANPNSRRYNTVRVTIITWRS